MNSMKAEIERFTNDMAPCTTKPKVADTKAIAVPTINGSTANIAGKENILRPKDLVGSQELGKLGSIDDQFAMAKDGGCSHQTKAYHLRNAAQQKRDTMASDDDTFAGRMQARLEAMKADVPSHAASVTTGPAAISDADLKKKAELINDRWATKLGAMQNVTAPSTATAAGKKQDVHPLLDTIDEYLKARSRENIDDRASKVDQQRNGLYGYLAQQSDAKENSELQTQPYKLRTVALQDTDELAKEHESNLRLLKAEFDLIENTIAASPTTPAIDNTATDAVGQNSNSKLRLGSISGLYRGQPDNVDDYIAKIGKPQPLYRNAGIQTFDEKPKPKVDQSAIDKALSALKPMTEKTAADAAVTHKTSQTQARSLVKTLENRHLENLNDRTSKKDPESYTQRFQNYQNEHSKLSARLLEQNQSFASEIPKARQHFDALQRKRENEQRWKSQTQLDRMEGVGPWTFRRKAKEDCKSKLDQPIPDRALSATDHMATADLRERQIGLRNQPSSTVSPVKQYIRTPKEALAAAQQEAEERMQRYYEDACRRRAAEDRTVRVLARQKNISTNEDGGIEYVNLAGGCARTLPSEEHQVIPGKVDKKATPAKTLENVESGGWEFVGKGEEEDEWVML